MNASSFFSRARTVQIPTQKATLTLTVLENSTEAVTVIFYPGTMSSPATYALLLEELHRLGCNIVALHPLNQGESLQKKRLFTFQDMVQSGLDAQAWAQHYFSGPIVLCGHSQGGTLSIAHALQAHGSGTRINALFPIGMILPHREDAINTTRFTGLKKYKKSFLATLRFFARLIPCLPVPLLAYLNVKNLLANAYKVRVPKGSTQATYPLRFVSSLFHTNLEQAEQEGCIPCPIVLITAKDDALFPLAMMRETLDAIHAPQKKCITLSGGGHLCAVSALYAQHIAAYIAENCAQLGLPLHTTQKYKG